MGQWGNVGRVLAASCLLLAVGMASGAGGLADAKSAFLRERAGSPVSWMPWGEAAFARAGEENKPMFLAIGEFGHELGRAMERQTFSRAEVAAQLNENFVCVLVDNSEHPEVDALYQTYVHDVKQVPGYPLNVWLTPEFEPFDGATYLPPSEEWGQQGFPSVLKRVLAAWQGDPEVQRRKAAEAVTAVKEAGHLPPPPSVDAAAIDELLGQGVQAWLGEFDEEHGAFGAGPQYPQPELLRFLLHREEGRVAALGGLRAILASPLRDPLDRGFFRYAIDERWQLPSFQKPMHLQARLALALLDAAKVSGDQLFAHAALGALHFVLDQPRDPAGGFISLEDATDAERVMAHLWTYEEISQVLGEKRAAEFARAHGATKEGNLADDAFPGMETKGRNLLSGGMTQDAGSEQIAAMRDLLRERRSKRTGPLRGGVATSGEHGLLLAALSRAAAELDDARCRAAAADLFAFINDHFRSADGGLLRFPDRPFRASPGDYAFVIEGVLAHQATSDDPSAGEFAAAIQVRAHDLYFDATSGRFFAMTEPLENGIWARIHIPLPGRGEPSSPEAAYVMALTTFEPSLDGPGAEMLGMLARAVASEIGRSDSAPRGDLLLALQRCRERH